MKPTSPNVFFSEYLLYYSFVVPNWVLHFCNELTIIGDSSVMIQINREIRHRKIIVVWNLSKGCETYYESIVLACIWISNESVTGIEGKKNQSKMYKLHVKILLCSDQGKKETRIEFLDKLLCCIKHKMEF